MPVHVPPSHASIAHTHTVFHLEEEIVIVVYLLIPTEETADFIHVLEKLMDCTYISSRLRRMHVLDMVHVHTTCPPQHSTASAPAIPVIVETIATIFNVLELAEVPQVFVMEMENVLQLMIVSVNVDGKDLHAISHLLFVTESKVQNRKFAQDAEIVQISIIVIVIRDIMEINAKIGIVLVLFTMIVRFAVEMVLV
jgi:hypothetical protein